MIQFCSARFTVALVGASVFTEDFVGETDTPLEYIRVVIMIENLYRVEIFDGPQPSISESDVVVMRGRIVMR